MSQSVHTVGCLRRLLAVMEAADHPYLDDVRETLAFALRCLEDLSFERFELDKVQAVVDAFASLIADPAKPAPDVVSSVLGRRLVAMLNAQLASQLEAVLFGKSVHRPQPIPIDDDDARQMWVARFGQTTRVASVDAFLHGPVRALHRELSDSEREALLSVLDPFATNVVSARRFGDFLACFGPAQHSIAAFLELASNAWFCGDISKSEVAKLLEFEPVGTFMVSVRLELRTATLYLAHTMPSVVNHVVIRKRDGGFAVREEGSERLFPSVARLVDTYSSSILLTPFRKTFHRREWWCGYVSREAATAVLLGEPPGTFLIHDVISQPKAFGASFVGQRRAFERGVITVTGTGYSVGGHESPTIEELVVNLQGMGVFTSPYKPCLRSKHLQLAETELLDTERSYVAQLDRLVDVETQDWLANSGMKPEQVATIFGGIAALREIHHVFLASLERAAQLGESFSACLLALAPQLEAAYAPFCATRQAAMDLLALLLKKRKIRAFHEEWQRGGMPLAGLLHNLPVGRMCRYALLCHDLLKGQPPQSAAWEQMSLAHAALEKAIDAVKRATQASQSSSSSSS
jgi:hypothetical protein